MLDINQIDISNIVENWLIDFNYIIQNSKSIDDKKITIDTGNGVVGFATSIGGIGGIGTIANKVPNALTPVFEATDATDYGQADQKMSSAGQWGYKHTVGGVGISIGYTPGGNTNGGADTGWSLSYADLMDGLEVGYGQQDDGTTSESETAYIKYVTGGITVAYQKSKVDYVLISKTPKGNWPQQRSWLVDAKKLTKKIFIK